MRWKEQTDGDVLVELRCPECHIVMQACHSQKDMADLDRQQAESRDVIRDTYERMVSESMTILADRLRDALDRDLIGPDDFAPRPASVRKGLRRAA
jgi:hypothetical protein